MISKPCCWQEEIDTTVMKNFTLVIIATHSFYSSQISKSNFNYCRYFDMFYYPAFCRHQTFCTNYVQIKGNKHVLRFCNLTEYVQIKGNKHVLRFCNLKETLIFMSKYRIESCSQMNSYLVFQSKDAPILSYPFWRRKKIVVNYIDFWV